MIFRFLILSDEVDNFVREIKIDSDATFLDLHNAIIESAGYTKDQMASFFICDDNWNRKTEITLIDMGTSPEEDSYIMEDTRLEELLEDEDQKLLYVFDYLTERAFFMELKEMILRETLDKPVCSRSEGIPPPQVINFEESDAKIAIANDLLGEDFYGDAEYNADELDSSGFEGLDSVAGNSFDEDRF
ncbi:MAG: plasmid pRiA4b ORF-3 family protein [Tannerellaceae bacterium]|jgi:hypothetical protein|nr:plasmid pRiA4b ORF-3 family protein [Tannerellaceae bacterium]